MTRNRFLQHAQKTEHINWAWFGIPHAGQRKLFPKCEFFSQESTKSYRRITYFYQKFRDLHFLCHLIWPRWFNFLVNECLNLTRFCFSVSYAPCIQQKKIMTKNWKKKILPTYLPILFFGTCNPQCRTQT